MLTLYEFHYDGQIRRFLEQVIRAFSGFQYMTGQTNGPPTLQVVPVTLATRDRQAANILRNNSENTMLSTPMIAVWPTNLRFDQERQQSPNFVSTVHVTERQIDPLTGKYTANRGNAFSVKRFMPMAFELTIDVYIWTSNLDQKFQIMEQILTTFAIGFDIQNSDNALDWTALTTIRLDDINLSSQTVPVGTETDIDLLTLTFKLPIWLSPPAKLKQQKLIEQVVANLRNADEIDLGDALPKSFDECAEDSKIAVGDFSQAQSLRQIIVTPGDHQIAVNGNQITLLGGQGSETDATGRLWDWRALIDRYGVLTPPLSTLTLYNTTTDIEDYSTTASIVDVFPAVPNAISGTIQYDPNNVNILNWTVDPTTLPANTLPAITGILNPMLTFPGFNLPAPATGQRYLLLNDLGSPTVAWGDITALTNDIIEFANGGWFVAFAASRANSPQYVLNQASGKQLRWTGQEWIMAIDGEYLPGYWRLFL